MSGSLIGGLIGAYFGGPWGYMIGSAIGGMLFPESGPTNNIDLRPTSSEYGTAIADGYGTPAYTGTVIWEHKWVVAGESGGKGADSPTPSRAYANFAVGLRRGGANLALGRIWAGPEKRLIWDGKKMEGGATVTFYKGTDTQLPDSLIESFEGVGNVPAYRGLAYIVISNFPLENDGNRLPILTVEVGTIQANIAPENLGSVDIQQTIVGADFSAVFYNGSYYGIVIRRLSDNTLIKHYTYPLGAWSLDATAHFWDPDHQVFVRVNRNTLTYTTIAYSNGLMTSHNITAAAGGDSNPGNQIRGGVYHNGTYIFAAAGSTGALSRVTLYGMNPVTHLPVFTYASTLPSGEFQGPLLKPTDSTSVVYGYATPAALYKFSLASGAAFTDLGAPVPGTLSQMMVDPNTGLIWSVASSSTSGYIEVHVSSPTTGLLYSAPVSAPMGLTANALTFVPALSGQPAKVIISGEQYIGIDNFVVFAANPPVLSGYLVGGYHGTALIDAMLYNPVTFGLQAYRRGGTITFGTPDDPTSVNMLIGNTFAPELDNQYLGTADATLIPGGQPLDQVVLDLCLKAGLTSAQVDVTALANDTVDGYPITGQSTVRDAITPLMSVYYFDAVESEGKVKFVKRGGSIAAVIPDDDVGVFVQGTEPPDPVETTRRMENELPRRLTVKYLLEATNYSVAAKFAQRLVGASGEEASTEFPIVMKDAKAQEVAEVNLHGAWVARVQYSFTLPRKYSYLEPTDLIVVHGYTMLLKKTIQNDGIIKCEADADETTIYTPKVVVTEQTRAPATTGTVGTAAALIWELA